MMLVFFAIVIVLWSAITIAKETCPAAYRRFSADHSFCKPANTTCQFISKGLQNKAEKDEILKLHNDYRSRVAVGYESGAGGLPMASNMLQMSWDEELAEIAQKWTEQCIFKHDCGECRSAKSFAAGQNIAIVEYPCSGDCEKKAPTWAHVMELLYGEVKFFDKELVKSWVYGAEYGDFTQIVWAETWRVGCGYVTFKNGENVRQLYVCNYGPPGNAEKSSVYKEGKPCSNCPQNSCCDRHCKEKSETKTYSGLCQLLSSFPVYTLDPKPLYFCAFEDNDANCKYDPKGDWKISKTAGGNFLTVVVKSSSSATAHFVQPIKLKKDSCMIISLRKGPNVAGEKDDSKLVVEFEQKGQKNEVIHAPTRPSENFHDLPLPVPLDGEIKFSIKLTVPAGAPVQYMQIKDITVTKEACKKKDM